MIDFFASATIAMIVVMTLVIFISNQRQAQILKQMRGVMEEWFSAQMRDRRETYRQEINMPDGLAWLGSQVGLTIVETRRRFEKPKALECMTAEGSRLVVSPLKKRQLRASLRSIENKRSKVSNLVEPLLGYKRRKVKVVHRSNETVHEWYEVEVETALEKLGLDWGPVRSLNFYIVPVESEAEKDPLISVDIHQVSAWFKNTFNKAGAWLKQQYEKASG